MATPQQYKLVSLKSACDRGQDWISKGMELFASQAGKISTVKSGYSKIRPQILPKGLNSYQQTEDTEDDEELTRIGTRPRFHSIDVIDGRVRDAYKHHLGGNLRDVPERAECGSREYIRASRETLLATPSIELRIVDAIATPKRSDRWRTKSRHERFIAKSIDDDNDIKVLPSVLLTYNPKFIRISDGGPRRYSLNASPSDSSHSLDSTA